MTTNSSCGTDIRRRAAISNIALLLLLLRVRLLRLLLLVAVVSLNLKSTHTRNPALFGPRTGLTCRPLVLGGGGSSARRAVFRSAYRLAKSSIISNSRSIIISDKSGGCCSKYAWSSRTLPPSAHPAQVRFGGSVCRSGQMIYWLDRRTLDPIYKHLNTHTHTHTYVVVGVFPIRELHIEVTCGLRIGLVRFRIPFPWFYLYCLGAPLPVAHCHIGSHFIWLFAFSFKKRSVQLMGLQNRVTCPIIWPRYMGSVL